MSFKSRSQEIIDATQIDPPENNEARIGGLFKDMGAVTETVDTIADLRAFDTSNLTEGESVYVKAHNTNGLKEGYGGGTFVWIPTAVFQTVSSSIGYLGSITTTASTVALSGDGEASITNEYYGDELVLSNGALITITSFQQAQEDNSIRSYGVGETSIRIALDSGTFTSGLDAYFKDDDGVYIRPTFAGFDGAGQWIRKLPEDNSITVDMYGAIGHGTKRTPTPFDSTSAIQKAFDSLFFTRIPARSYYISSTIIVDRAKMYIHEGFSMSLPGSTEGGRRFKRIIEGDVHGIIYTDQNIDVLEIRAQITYHGMIDTTQVVGHTKRAIRINANDRISGEIKVKIAGNEDSLGPDLTTGTQAIIIDQSDPDLTRDKFTNSGGVSGLQIYASIRSCYIGVGATEKDPDVNTFVNGVDIYWHADNVKKPVDMKEGLDLSEIIGIYQSRDGLLSAPEQSTIPVCYVERNNGGTVDLWGWDMVGTGRHNILLEVNSSNGSLQGGPLITHPSMWNQANYVPDSTKEKFNLGTRLNGDDPFTIDQTKAFLKRVEREVTSSEILNSNTTPIVLIPGRGGQEPGIIVHRAHIKRYTGTTSGGNYSTNTNMDLIQNPTSTGSSVATTIDLSSSPGVGPVNLPVTQTYGFFNNSASASEVLELKTRNGNPTGGTVGFVIVVVYEEVFA